TDGTPAGTALVKDILPGALGSYPHGLVGYGGRLYFAAYDGRADRLFRTDGTAAGTAVVSDLGFAPGGSPTTSYSWMDNLTVFNGGLYFTFYHDRVVDLYRTNGTAVGTLRLARLSLVDSGPGIANLTVVKGLLFFTATRTGDTHELWRTDGTVAGTRLVRGFRTGGLGSSGPGHLTALGNTLLFTADDGVRGNELWKSDGTTAGTVLVKDVNPGPASAFLPAYYFSGTDKAFPVVGGVAYFSADDGAHGGELWKSDGTAKGTVLVKDIFSGSGSLWPGGPVTPNTSGISWLTAFNGQVYFSATDGTRGYELWKTDGTSKGTVLVKDIYPGSSASSPVPGIPTNSGYPVNLTVFNGALYFAAIDPQRGRELWVTDGTAAGTRLAAEVVPGPRDGVGISSVPSGRGIWGAGGKLYLIGWDAAHGPELWWFAPPPG
ncbi:MAG: ELWxxDGT repeat protein, partial [Gemmataceae bacterium]